MGLIIVICHIIILHCADFFFHADQLNSNNTSLLCETYKFKGYKRRKMASQKVFEKSHMVYKPPYKNKKS